jgi:predicted nucleic acid-binding Zn ribbon protein
MRRKETQRISDIITEVTRNTDLGSKLQETRLMENWVNILGPMIGNSTRKLFISKRVLFVYIESPVIRHELFMMRTRLLEVLNQSVGENIVDTIVFR